MNDRMKFGARFSGGGIGPAVGRYAAGCFLCGLLLAPAAGALTEETDRRAESGAVFTDPYEGIEWDAIGYYDANLHTHTNYSDGRYDPHYAIDTYHELGYEILALTDHDSLHYQFRPEALYPWTELNDIFHEIKDETNRRFDATYAEVADEEWQNRDPEELGMVAVPGSEISRTHHIGSLFNLYAGGTQSEETAFTEIGERGGLSLFYHPGRYDRDADWYAAYYERHDHVVGMEVYNQIDRYPVDRAKWDRVLYRLMPDRPVWGFANDDTHVDEHFGRNRNVFLLPELTLDAVYDAVKFGHFFFFVPVERGTPPPVHLERVEVDGGSIELFLSGEYETVEWITHNPETGDSERVGEGTRISVDDLPFATPFVRAVIIGEKGRTYTQPFGVRES